jgi:magnesium chelatase subunit D
MNNISLSSVFPFAGILGQEDMKLALLLNAVNPHIGGVLVRGEKGTAKSTTVRALAALLPEITVFAGCPFQCGPEEKGRHCARCNICEGPRPLAQCRVKVVNLPLNATEDRVAGGIDFDRAVRTGRRVVQPGLLARSHRGILYVDEVNLLDDHLVDVILDSAASGQNLIEREGISFSHPSRFVLVGTMNPEEGELRPQLLDRFGLCVEVRAVADRKERVSMMILRERFDENPEQIVRQFAEETRSLSKSIEDGRQRLTSVSLPDHLRSFIGDLCREAYVAGHRADLVIEQAARAHAAFQGRNEVTVDDVARVAPMALCHRKRDASPPQPPPPQEHEHKHEHPPDSPEETPQQENREEGSKEDESQQPAETDGEGRQEESPPPEPDQNPEPPQDAPPVDVMEKVFEVGETFTVKRLSTPKDRIFRRGSGRRSRTRISGRQGRYVRSTEPRGTKDVALDATLRAAAPHQLHRKAESNLAVALRPQDVREKIRERRVGNFLLFVVDVSGSMGSKGRMTATKGAIMSLLLDAYQKRDKVAMISFCKTEARLNLPPTSSIELAARMLAELPVGGRTPLSAALVKSSEVLRSQLVRDPTSRPIVLLLTDGRSNVPLLGDNKPVDESLAIAGRLSVDERVRFIVVDTEAQSLVRFDLAAKIAKALNAAYFKTNDLQAETLLEIVKGDAHR